MYRDLGGSMALPMNWCQWHGFYHIEKECISDSDKSEADTVPTALIISPDNARGSNKA